MSQTLDQTAAQNDAEERFARLAGNAPVPRNPADTAAEDEKVAQRFARLADDAPAQQSTTSVLTDEDAVQKRFEDIARNAPVVHTSIAHGETYFSETAKRMLGVLGLAEAENPEIARRTYAKVAGETQSAPSQDAPEAPKRKGPSM